jgi:hypothetical protein
MATMAMYGKIGANIFGGEVAGDTFAIDYLSDTIKVALATTTYVPDPDTHEVFSDVTNELTTALGYTAGGATLGTKTATYNATGNITAFDAADTSWTAAGGSLIFRYAIVYKSTGTGSTSPLIGYLDFATQTITDGNTVTIVWYATNGVFKVTAV